MKRIFLFYCLFALCLSCQTEDLRTEMIIRVKESKISCTGYEGQTECYLIQQGEAIDTELWQYFYENIEGFNYEPGFTYKLLISKEPVKNPPMDAPRIKYTLIKELSKEVN